MFKQKVSLLATMFLFLSFVNLFTFPKNQVQQKHVDTSPYFLIAEGFYKDCLAEGRLDEFCYSKKFGELSQRESLQTNLAVLTQLEQIDPNARGCHSIAHTITFFVLEKNPDSWQEMLNQVSSNRCSGGFVHGVLEAHSRFDKNFVLNEKTIPEICSLLPEGEEEHNCSHILGHILLATNEGYISSAVGVCQKIPQALRNECLGGVFMENMTLDNLIAHGIVEIHLNWNKEATENQERICNKYGELAAQACWREISHMYAFTSNNNPITVWDLCFENSNNHISATECYMHGAAIAVSSSNFSESNLKWLCNPYASSQSRYRHCLSSVVDSLMASSIHFTDRAIAFCQTILDGEKEECFNFLGERLVRLTDINERKILCSGAPSEYKNMCLGRKSSAMIQ